MSTLLPRSTATNAYDLFLDVVKAVEEEPMRLNMGVVVVQPGDRLAYRVEKWPSCQTVGCVAGWIEILSRVPLEQMFDVDEACVVVGATPADGDPDECVHDEFSRDLDDLFFHDFPNLKPGNPEYVAHVVNRIRAFMTKHEARLRATVPKSRLFLRPQSDH